MAGEPKTPRYPTPGVFSTAETWLADPGDDHRAAVRARWLQARDEARELNVPGGDFGI